MKLILKSLFLFIVVIALLVGVFSLYAHFLMDYSLDSLTQAAVAASPPDLRSEKMSNAAQNMYQNMVQDMALEQIGQDNADYQDLSLLDLAARSLDEAQYRAGFARAGVYLNKVIEIKRPARHPLLAAADEVVKKVLRIWDSIYLFAKYSLAKLFRVKPPEKIQIEAYSSALLLNQAQEKERQGLLAKAESDYLKFLKAYAGNENRSLVIISLANIMMRQRKFSEAENFLLKSRSELIGKPENDLAGQMTRRLANIQKQSDRIEKLKEGLPKLNDAGEKQKALLQMAVANMSIYNFDQAGEILGNLTESEDGAMRQKAGFYLAWIYKFREDYDKSAAIFSRLLKDPLLSSDLELGVRSQLADVYYKKGDAKKSAEQYQVISNKTLAKSAGGIVTTHAAWSSFSEIELVNIYRFDFKNTREVRERMDRLINMAESETEIAALGASLDQAGKLSLRDLGFHAITEKKLIRALDFFTKYLAKHPDDGMTLTGLATVYALMGDLDNALIYARKGYNQQAGEYATLMLGYIESLKGNYSEAIKKYEQVISTTPDSVPAKYNLAYIYIKKNQFEKSLAIMNPLEQSLAAILDRKFLRAKTFNNIGYCYWALKDNQKAIEWFGKAAVLSPELILAKNNLTQLEKGRKPEAAKPTD